MKYTKRVLPAVILIASTLFASTLDIYDDKSIYRYIPADRYIGFVSEIDTKCGDETISIFNSRECEKNNYLCKEYKNISKMQTDLTELRYKIRALNTAVNRLSLNTLDAKKVIDASNILAKEYASAKFREKIETLKLHRYTKRFNSMTTYPYPLYLESDCKKELKIAIPSSYITAGFIQRATLESNGNIEINRLISIKNRSGIDIVAKSANIHFQTYQRNTRIPHFKPWLLSPRRQVLYKSRSKSLSPMPTAMVDTATAERVEIGNTTKKDFRDYSIAGLILPSDGKEYEQKIYTEKVPVLCEETAYTYLSPFVHNICSFKSSTPVEENSWEIITPKGSKIYTEGRYEDGKYLLDTGIDESIKIRKNRLPSKDRKSGFFGSDIKKTDGYIITLTNRTKESKSITLIDRIPYSKSDKIRVTLDSVSGAESKKVTKYGKLTLRVNLKPLENRTVKVVFSM